MRLYPRALLPGLFALASWFPVALPARSIQHWLPPNRYEFGLPRVCVPYTPGSDVVSLVPDLFSALAVAGLCLVLSEIAKFLISRLTVHNTPLCLALSAYQVTLVVDALRSYAWDWYGYFLYFARFIELRYDEPRPEIIPIPAPWMSLTALLLFLCLYVATFFRQPSHTSTG